jgi:hypothetical protein
MAPKALSILPVEKAPTCKKNQATINYLFQMEQISTVSSYSLTQISPITTPHTLKTEKVTTLQMQSDWDL